MMGVMLDSKSEVWESKQSCQDLSLNFFPTILSRSMVIAEEREVIRRLQRAAMLGDESNVDERSDGMM